jgi:hypothetical protein
MYLRKITMQITITVNQVGENFLATFVNPNCPKTACRDFLNPRCYNYGNLQSTAGGNGWTSQSAERFCSSWVRSWSWPTTLSKTSRITSNQSLANASQQVSLGFWIQALAATQSQVPKTGLTILSLSLWCVTMHALAKLPKSMSWWPVTSVPASAKGTLRARDPNNRKNYKRNSEVQPEWDPGTPSSQQKWSLWQVLPSQNSFCKGHRAIAKIDVVQLRTDWKTRILRRGVRACLSDLLLWKVRAELFIGRSIDLQCFGI